MAATKGGPAKPDRPDGIQRVIEALLRVSGTDFSDFRETTLQRRVSRRMGLLGIGGLDEYAELLERDEAEVSTLFHDVLINVTGFFRDPEAFETLKRLALPAIIERDESDGIRLWVPGCSTGEEPFSLAIALSEALATAGVNRQVQIFATDLNEKHIAHARAATYPSERMSLVSPERLESYFDRTETGWRVSKQIRQMCVFALHDLTRDPPFTRMDLISCRNLLIYWNRTQQDRILPLFHYALRQDGFLLLGSAESATRVPQIFDLVDSAAKLYRRCPASPATRVSFGLFHADRLAVPAAKAPRVLATEDVIAEAGRMVAREDALAAVVVDSALNSLYFWGRTDTVFAPTSGETSASLARLLAPSLLADALSAINEVGVSGVSAWRGPIDLASGDEVFLHVSPVRAPGNASGLLILVDLAHPADVKMDTTVSNGITRELEGLREELSCKVEELSATNEELRTSEDQLRDANRSLLEANAEQFRRNVDLQSANDDLANVLASVRIPLVVLDGDGCIRTFTPPAEALLGLRPDDVGRMLADLNAVSVLPELERLIAEVSFDLEPREHQFVDASGRAHLLHVSPYISGGQAGHGVVLAFLDVELTRRRVLEESSRLMSALIAINATMNSALDADEIMRGVMVEAVDAIGADAIVLYGRGEEGWTASYSAGTDEEIVGTVLTDGELPYLTAQLHEEPWSVRDADADPAFSQSPLRLSGSRSIAAVQLSARDQIVGALVFGFNRKTRFSQAKLDFVTKLGTAVSIALENARLYGAQRHVAERLQEALLQLPEKVAGIECASRYRAALDEALVGGDFYDVFELGEHRVALVVGDVMGKGLDAATMTALAKNALRAHALEDSEPAKVFGRLNRLVHRFTPVGTFLTAFYGVLDTRSGQLIYSSAGHPPAIVLRSKGARFLKTINPILGALENVEYATFEARLGPKDTLVLYTDGIIEARDSAARLYGEERLLDMISSVARADPDELLEAIMDDVLSYSGGQLRDDVALLAVRRAKG